MNGNVFLGGIRRHRCLRDRGCMSEHTSPVSSSGDDYRQTFSSLIRLERASTGTLAALERVNIFSAEEIACAPRCVGAR